MPNDSQEFNKIINLSIEPLKEFRKLLSMMVEGGGNEMEVRDLDDLHLDFKGKFKTKLLHELRPDWEPPQIKKQSWFAQPNLPIAKDNMGTAYIGNKIYTIGDVLVLAVNLYYSQKTRLFKCTI